ncbi:MAG: polyphosphate polymerase domain-containing protein [Clostridia bacterium]|nr:polyphosphate polymerase domain-containing protein [Clostridia bacterium]
MTKIDSKLRHEYKCRISQSDKAALISRLSLIMSDDPHYGREPYHIRSLYFDNVYDKALTERMNGQQVREKFRIRYYNSDSGYIMLEKKSKRNGLCLKESCRLSAEEAQRIVDGELAWLLDPDRPLCAELYAKMQSQGLRPKTIVDYTRDPFVYAPGNVRVTIDYNIRTGQFRTDFLNPQTLTLPAGESPIILEVKWDEFLPDSPTAKAAAHSAAAANVRRCQTAAVSLRAAPGTDPPKRPSGFGSACPSSSLPWG